MFSIGVICLLLPMSILAQDESSLLKESRENLTGNFSREWIAERFERFLGQGDQCVQGETFTFHADGRLIVKQCLNETIELTEYRWSLEQISELDVELRYDDKSYRLLFFSKESDPFIEYMTLRLFTDEKTDPVEDREFQREVD